MYWCNDCSFKGSAFEMDKHMKDKHQVETQYNIMKNVMPEGQGKRDAKRPRHDLIPVEFLDGLASIFEEGLPKYGDSWKKGGNDFLIDCLNHASNHLHLYMNGDHSENQLAKVAWNVLCVAWHNKRVNNLIASQAQVAWEKQQEWEKSEKIKAQMKNENPNS